MVSYKVLLVFLLLSQVLGSPVPASKIVGGVSVSIEKFSYQVSLRISGSHVCGGSIIGPSWVLTAAHCVYQKSQASLSIRAGSATRNAGGTLHQISMVVQHERYTKTTTDYDLALLKVTPNFTYSNSVKAIPLASSSLIVADKTPATVSGWGYTRKGDSTLPVTLQAIKVTTVDQTQCQRIWDSKPVTARMICAGGTNSGGVGACNGDSGGPMVSRDKLIGVVSWGSPCAKPNVPDVYANVINMRSWIQSKSGV